MSNFLFKKAVDKSLLEEGMTIPKEIQQKLLSEIGVSLPKGGKIQVTVSLDGKIHEARLTNVNLSETYSEREVLQIRYSTKSSLGVALNQVFNISSYTIQSSNDVISTADYLEVYSAGHLLLDFKCFPVSLKENFFKYIGNEDSLSGYTRSYKLVFFKCFFELLTSSGEVSAETLTKCFKNFYMERKKSGLLVDRDVDSIIESIELSTELDIYRLILRNPFNVISKKGFILKATMKDKEYFALHHYLGKLLSPEDISSLLDLINRKLIKYFETVDTGKGIRKELGLRDIIVKLFNEYVTSSSEPFAGHQMGSFFRNEIPNIIYQTGIARSENYKISGSVGQGTWAQVPWFAIFDREITTSASKGVYIVYLLSKNGDRLYLTLEQAGTEIRKNNTRRETIRLLREKADEIISRVDARGFKTDVNVNLGSDLTELADFYQKGVIYYKEYRKESLPTEDEMRGDLKGMIDVYKDYADLEKRTKPAWLLTWNPQNNKWEDLEKEALLTREGKSFEITWACSSTQVEVGDIFYMIVLGMGNKNGIFATGIALSSSYEDTHWDDIKRAQGMTARRIKIRIDRILDIYNEDILYQSKLEKRFPNQKWNPQNSGISIREEYFEQLAVEWMKIANTAVSNQIQEATESVEGEKEMSVRDTINYVKEYIASKGFQYDDGIIENFYLSLKSKPLVILAGISGTGKTRLVKLFAEALGANSLNGRYKMVAVRPDWSDSSDLFGHVDLNGKFIPGAIIEFVKAAQQNNSKPYFLCLDEMNLARVEYYFSDVLSIIETREFVNDNIESEALLTEGVYGNDTDASGKYGIVRLPENLYIIGTVNMDETTFPFSKKVLDRANTIEFSYVDLLPQSNQVGIATQQTNNIDNNFLKTKYLLLAQCFDHQALVEEICLELQTINGLLRISESQIGYRVRDEIVFYMVNNLETGLLQRDKALDNVILQKILPRLQGSNLSIKKMLCELFKHCAVDYESYNTENDDISSRMFKAVRAPGCKYRKSAEKIAFMIRRYEEDGFTSYWL